MLIENLKDGLQVSVHQQPTGCRDVHDCNFPLERDRLEDVGAAWSSRRDLGTFTSRVLRIQDVDGDIFLNCRKYRRRMQNLRAKICEFGGFVKTDDLDPARIRTQSWIGGHHPVYVGPDLDPSSVQSSAKYGG